MGLRFNYLTPKINKVHHLIWWKLQTLDSLNNSIISDFRDKVRIDSVVVAELGQQIKTHEETIKLLGKKVVLVKPKWYESKFVWGIIGSAPAYYIGYLIGKL